MVMAQHRQSGVDRFSVRVQNDAADRIPYRPARIRRPGKAARRPSPAALAAALALVLFISLVASGRIFSSRKGFRRDLGKDDDAKDELGLNESAHWKELKFGHDSDKTGRDSRFRDEDDRRRGGNYREEDLPNEQHRAENYRFFEKGWRLKERIPVEHPPDKVNEKRNRKAVARLYNEGGRAELDYYKEEYEASVKDDYELKQGNETTEDNFDEYDDGIDALDTHDEIHDDVVPRRLDDSDGGESKNDTSLVKHEKYSAQIQVGPAGGLNSKNVQDRMGSETAKSSAPEKKSVSKKRPHRTSCEINFLNSTAQLVEPLIGKKFAKFSLQYTQVENMPNGSENWEPRFSGHQTLEEREKSFYAHDQTVNCGFIKGPSGSPSTGFDIAEEDLNFMSSCHIAVSSCIFGNSDHLRTPFTKTITQLSRKNVCFVMFLDEITLETLLSEGLKFENGLIGMWRLVVIKNFPYTDMRRVGKIPKFLAHRLFPSSRYSIWLDSKLRLQSDPYLILEYFLWRRGYEYAISNHYDRHCVWDEVMQNKKLNKYNHTVIDQQFDFYQSDGLKRFNPSDPKKLLPSYVPEGSFIVRAHTPMSNLFSCLWFNEVDRFTSRDQLSFAYTYLKLRRMNPGKPFFLNMFKDCERRAMAKLFHHRSEEKRIVPTQSAR